MTALYRAAVGPIHADRYLPLFERLDAAGRALPRWNWAAALSTLNWMVFRRLWGAALVYVAALEAVGLLGFAIGRQVLQLPLPIFGGLALAFVLIACAVPGLYGDAVFHADVRKRITKALSASATLPQAAELLAKQAASWRRLGWIAAANVALAAAIAAAYLLLPSSNPFADETLAPPPATQPVTEAGAPMIQPAASAPAASAAKAVSVPVSPASDTADAQSPSPASAAVPASSAASAAVAPSVAPVPTTPPPVVLSPSASTAPPTPTGANKPPAAPSSTPASAPGPVPAPVAQAETGNATTPPRAASATRPATAPAASTSRAPTATASKPAPAPRSVRPAAPAARPASTASAPASSASTPAARRLYINVGLFADPANARRAHAKLQEAGLPATSDPVTFNSGKRLTRVRVGPFASSSEANAATERVRAMGLDAAAHQQ